MFEQEALQKVISKALDDTVVPDGHKAALATIVNSNGVKVVIAHKIGDGWSVAGELNIPHKEGLNYGVTITKTW